MALIELAKVIAADPAAQPVAGADETRCPDRAAEGRHHLPGSLPCRSRHEPALLLAAVGPTTRTREWPPGGGGWPDAQTLAPAEELGHDQR